MQGYCDAKNIPFCFPWSTDPLIPECLPHAYLCTGYPQIFRPFWSNLPSMSWRPPLQTVWCLTWDTVLVGVVVNLGFYQWSTVRFLVMEKKTNFKILGFIRSMNKLNGLNYKYGAHKNEKNQSEWAHKMQPSCKRLCWCLFGGGVKVIFTPIHMWIFYV